MFWDFSRVARREVMNFGKKNIPDAACVGYTDFLPPW